MTTDTTNSGGKPESATVTPSTDINDASNLNFWEPEESDANPEDQEEGAIDDDRAPDEASEESQEAEDDSSEDAADEGEGEPEEGDEPETDEPAAINDDVTVTLPGGETVKLAELKQGYMKDRDYRHKTTELSGKRKEVEALSSRLNNTVDAFVEFLTSQIPDEPNPNLAITNPPQYTRDKAIYDAAVRQIEKIVAMGNEPKEVADKLTEQQRKESLAEENAKLAERFPQTTDPNTRKQFFESAFNVAREVGFSDDEMKGVSDHRIFALAHYAKLGMEAEQAREKARTKVENKPPVTPQKKQHSKNASAIRRNQEAMKRLAKTGSIHDAMSIDFD